jgi:CBS domain-containing protein
MTRDPVTTIMKADAASAAQIMSQRNFGALPVVERALEGIITRTDLLKGYKLAVS